MNKGHVFLWAMVVVLFSCKDDTVSVFEKPADDRVDDAVSALHDDLIDPPNGWKLRYRPESGSGSYWVFLKFEDNGSVHILSDLGANDGEFFDQTITYRVDSRLGIELILESYCFFSFLFEQEQATFGAEYEFHFVNKTPDDALVFRSKSDVADATILVFEEAGPNEAAELLGTEVAQNLNTLADDLNNISSALKVTYTNKDLLLFVSLDNFRRTLTFTSAAKKTNSAVVQSVDFSTPYIVQGDSIVFDAKLSGTFVGVNINIRSIKFNTLTNSTLNVCATPIPIHGYTGVTSGNDAIVMETSLLDAQGAGFATLSDFYYCPIEYIFDEDGFSVANQIATDVKGAGAMQLYYNYDLGGGPPFYAIGFYIQNTNGTTTFALREFTPTLTNNNIVFNFAPDISIFGSQQTEANIDNINIYLANGGDTYVFEYADNIYEFFNPCTGWSFVFLNANQ
jgi:hypothetical protein